MDSTDIAAPQSSTGNMNNIENNKSLNYSPPASPASSMSGDISPVPTSTTSAAAASAAAVLPAVNAASISISSPASGVMPRTASVSSTTLPTVSFSNTPQSPVRNAPMTYIPRTPPNCNKHPYSGGRVPGAPKKARREPDVLQIVREKLLRLGGASQQQTLRLESPMGEEPLNVIKGRYLISTRTCQIPPDVAARTPASYRHLIALTSSSLRCTDVFTEQQYLCKIVNEPLHKVQQSYFQLKQEGDNGRSSIYGHVLIRGAHDIVPLSQQRTYVIVAPAQKHEGAEGVYEDLHTYIRNKRRLCETEARALFHQICETVRICHRNGIIMRDLKLKRFFFIDEARTKLQYESLEGSMILDDPNDDLLSDKIGCPLYTAPELLCPTPTYRGKPADMWSLGVILYTMLVGQYPFYEKGNCNLITVIRQCQVQLPMSLSKSVCCLLLFLLRKNYHERMKADQVFLSRWLKQQRPYYMYIPVSAEISDEEEELALDEPALLITHNAKMLNGVLSASFLASLSTNSATTSSGENSDVHCDIILESEPLDYSRRGLQTNSRNNGHITNNGGDAQME